jgi:hypothetical protein
MTNGELEIEILKFEYERLQAENLKHTDWSYVFFGIFIPLSAGLIGYSLTKDLGKLDIYALAFLSMSLLLIAYLIDGRLNYQNAKRNARLQQIEELMVPKMWNYRLLLDKIDLPDELNEKIKENLKKFKFGCIFEKFRLHMLFEVYIFIVAIFWIARIVVDIESTDLSQVAQCLSILYLSLIVLIGVIIKSTNLCRTNWSE